jgi:hypothetical protein
LNEKVVTKTRPSGNTSHSPQQKRAEVRFPLQYPTSTPLSYDAVLTFTSLAAHHGEGEWIMG